MANTNYFTMKEQYKQYAINHTEEMARTHNFDIQWSVDNSEIISGPDIIDAPPVNAVNIKLEYWDLDTVSAIFNASRHNNCNIWALNFASYKNPGGMFIQGSSAQEESLCRESFLYNVLSNNRFKDYYGWNRKNLNGGLYTNRMIISPNVFFMRDINERPYIATSNVITCAAPNYSVGLKYGRFSKEENDIVMENRIRFILSVLADGRINTNDTLIIGAFGCGVFRQDPEMVSQLWSKYLYMLRKECKVVFAVPRMYKDSIYFEDVANNWGSNTELRNDLLSKFNKKG